jgi:hypothetical protein
MKTQTAEEILKKQDWCQDDVIPFETMYYKTTNCILKAMHDHTTTQIEALRERLQNEFSLSGQKIIINHVFNNFLKEINP